MTTTAQVRKYAKESFLPWMSSQGFILFGSFDFYRRRNGVYDLLLFTAKNGGWNLKCVAMCWAPECSPQYDMANFPKRLPVNTIWNGGYVSEFGVDFGGGSPSIRYEKDVSEALSYYANVIEKHALPWFETVPDLDHLLGLMDKP